jgi:hypothetical protein
MRHIVVESLYEPPLTEVAMSAAFERLEPLLRQSGIVRLRVWVADDRTRAVGEFEAPDIQTLADAYERARVPFARIWSGKIYEFNLPTFAIRARDTESYEELADP